MIFDVKDDVYKKQGINFPALKHLDAIGLISFEPLSGFAREGFIKNGMISYYGRPLLIEFQSESNNQIRVGQVLLTDLGMQLTKICGSEPDQEFYEYAVKKMHEQGLILSSFPQSYLF